MSDFETHDDFKTHKALVTTVAGNIYVNLPNNGYIKMDPEQARRMATRLYVKANEAEGLAPPQVIVFQDPTP